MTDRTATGRTARPALREPAAVRMMFMHVSCPVRANAPTAETC